MGDEKAEEEESEEENVGEEEKERRRKKKTETLEAANLWEEDYKNRQVDLR